MNRIYTTDRMPPVLESRYNADFAAWAQHQAGLLRAGNLAAADTDHIAEELEGLANSDRRALASHVRNILVHLIKLLASPATDPRAGWEETIANARAEIEAIVGASPSLARELPGIIAAEQERATRIARRALAHYGEDNPVNLPPPDTLGPDEVLEDWFPTE